MKVLAANARKETFFVELDALEFDRITNRGSGWRFDGNCVGMEFAVSKTWDTLRALNEGRAELPKIGAKLRALADLLQPIECEVPQPKETEHVDP